MMQPMTDYTKAPDAEKIRLSAHALLDAVREPDLIEDSVTEAMRQLYRIGVMGREDEDVAGTMSLVKAATFLLSVLVGQIVNGEHWPAGREALYVVYKAEIDKAFLPGGKPPSSN
jgi:hypothetical protein